jgi:multidrug efflux pump subunit AcrA (membrane-fusion protein)
MIRFLLGFITLFIILSSSIGADDAALPSSTASRSIRLSHCLVSLIDDVQVSAEKAGVLTVLSIKEGDYIDRDASVATIDDILAKHQIEATRADQVAAQAKADSELEIEFAIATHRTAESEHRIATTANTSLSNTVAAVEVEKLRLAAEQARIKIGVSQLQRQIHGNQAQSFAAKALLAEQEYVRHHITAPLAGEVVEVFFRRGEWVEPGKPILRLVRLDRLRVEGFVRFADHAPADVLRRPVRVEIVNSGGRRAVFVGTVTFVSPLIQPGGEYRIWAEVDNRRDRDQWLLRPGLEAEMAIEAVSVAE